MCIYVFYVRQHINSSTFSESSGGFFRSLFLSLSLSIYLSIYLSLSLSLSHNIYIYIPVKDHGDLAEDIASVNVLYEDDSDPLEVLLYMY